MKSIVAAVCCVLIAGIVTAGPVVVEDSAVLTRPDASWQYFGRFGVAIDGDLALVSGERYVADPAAEGGQRHEGTAFIYRRVSATRWTYVARLGPVAPITNLHPGLAMKDGIAMTITDRYRMWQRSGDTWVLQPAAGITPVLLNGPDIEIDAGRIAVACASCSYGITVLSKVNNTWLPEIVPSGFDVQNVPETPAVSLDLQGNQALVSRAPVSAIPAMLRLRRTGSGWEPDMTDWQLSTSYYYESAPLAVFGEHRVIDRSRQAGTQLLIEHDSVNDARLPMRPADLAMQPGAHGTSVIERVGNLIAQRNFRYDTQGSTYHLFRIDEDAFHTRTEVAMLQPADGSFLGDKLDSSAGRVIVGGWGEGSGDNRVRIFELPATLADQPATVHDFEPPVSASAWQPTAGSAFSVVKVGYTNVYRQSSTVGTPGSFLQTPMRDQAIEADVTLRAFVGADRWVGFATRRSDDANYYYVTFRTSGVIELKRMQNGAITTLAAAPAALAIGRPYKLRLESIGTLHRVFLDGRLLLSARDTNLGEGVAGVLMNRAAADWDNVTVTQSPFTTIFADDFSAMNDLWPSGYNLGVYQPGGYIRQSTTKRGENFAGSGPDDEVVAVRIRPVSFATPQDWVGLAGHIVDARNNIYVSLHGRSVIALWKRVNGNATQLATQRLTVTPGTWYDLRLEIVGGSTRVYVDGQQVLSSNAALEPLASPQTMTGLALQTQNATADFDDVLAYRP